jgi:hypothetical protein
MVDDADLRVADVFRVVAGLRRRVLFVLLLVAIVTLLRSRRTEDCTSEFVR